MVAHGQCFSVPRIAGYFVVSELSAVYLPEHQRQKSALLR